jgi:hypothetical protein
MKKGGFFLLVLLVSITSVNGQTNVYHPFPTHNAFWGGYSFYYQTLSNNESCQYFQDFTVGDTTVGIYLYHKLRASGLFYPLGYCNSPNYTPIRFDNYAGAFREDTLNKKVYFLPPGSSSDTLLYDFNLHLGDTLPQTYTNYEYPGNWVSKIDSVLVGNKYHKRYGITGPGFGSIDTNYAFLIEGVGCTCGGILASIHGQGEAPSGSTLDCFSVNGSTLYPDTNSHCVFYSINSYPTQVTNIAISPNPFTTSAQITLDKTYHNITLAVYDIQGKLMLQKQYADCSQIQLNRNGLGNGMYFLKLTMEDKWVETGKIIVSE